MSDPRFDVTAPSRPGPSDHVPGIASTYTLGHGPGAADAEPAVATTTPHAANTTATAIPRSLRTDLYLRNHVSTANQPRPDQESVGRDPPIRQRRLTELS
ncbi:Uncharacterised protein [Mycobacteroides abscessus subsp. abscessus]|nr:Uncharacterised protein [Mycobacteroides abscessus subsp. abscessus]